MSLKLATRTLAREKRMAYSTCVCSVTKKRKEKKKGIRCVLGEFDQTYFDFQQQSPTTITTTICSFNNQYFTNFFLLPTHNNNLYY